jgi:hypothetical protein
MYINSPKSDDFGDKVVGVVFVIIGILAVIFLISLLFAYPVKWLWNSTMPELFGLKEIGLWMAWKLSLLCAFLFKSFNTSFKS